jgi:hypothetical protein
MKTKIGTLTKNGVIHEDLVDFHKIPSNDPIAFYFGSRDAKFGIKLPKKGTLEYKELASEYIRGFKSI